MSQENYHIRLPQFEGPFDLLLFFIERDELDIYNIPISKITNDFLAYIRDSKELNIELSSEFILFVSTLMRIKAKMLLPRKELDDKGNEVDPRQELVDKIIEYKRFKEASAQMSVLEDIRRQMIARGNVHEELMHIGREAGEGTEIHSLSLFKLMRAFEKVARRLHDERNKPVHTVVNYHYTMEEARESMIDIVSQAKLLPFETIFDACENRIHAIFMFLTLLELAQQRFLTILSGEGVNNFMVRYEEPQTPATAE